MHHQLQQIIQAAQQLSAQNNQTYLIVQLPLHEHPQACATHTRNRSDILHQSLQTYQTPQEYILIIPTNPYTYHQIAAASATILYQTQ